MVGEGGVNAELRNGLAVDDSVIGLQRAGGCGFVERSVGSEVCGEYASDWKGLDEKWLEVGDVDVSGVDVGVEDGIGVVGWLRSGGEMTMGPGWRSGAKGRGQICV